MPDNPVPAGSAELPAERTDPSDTPLPASTIAPTPAVNGSRGDQRDSAPDPRRWTALVFISLAQLMVALDATIINIALPSAQRSLNISDPQRQWAITAYTLAFGGLLLLGGRLADTLGRKRTFLAGLVGFAIASAAGGAAPNFAALVLARAAQGASAALLAPSVLSLLALTFTAPKERAKAFAVFGTIVGTGGALGLLLGGLLTEYVSWRWCLFVNVPVAIATFFGGLAYLADIPAQVKTRLDIPGVLTVTGGLLALVYGLSEAASKGWTSSTVITAVGGGLLLLVVFVVIESRVDSPLLPLRIVLDRNRGGSYLTVALAVIGMYGLFLFLSYYFQVVQGYSPARAGVAFLPLSVAVLLGSTVVARKLLPLVPPRVLIVPGLLLAASGMATLTQLGVHADYFAHVLPGELLLGLGMGAVFVPAISTATSGVGPRDAGVASATANTSQQIGASLGVALLNTIAASATASYLLQHPNGSAARAEGLVHGYAVAAACATAIFLVAALQAGLLITTGRPQHGHASAEHTTSRPRRRPNSSRSTIQ
jgi:EmrB/QacA subfamily drug resistance transporter